MAEEVFSMIKKTEPVSDKEKSSTNKKLDWLIFSVNTKLFALPSSKVKEILRDSQVFTVPFVPSYISGILNRYGDPYCVVDPAVLIGDSAQNTSLFIVVNDATHTCIRITDVKEFFAAPESDIRKFTDLEISEYYEGTLKHKDDQIFVLNTDAILEKMDIDFERA